MPLQVDVGKGELDRLAKTFRETARVDVAKEMDEALLDAGDAIGHGVRDATDIYMPRGYEATFSRALVIKTVLRRGAARGVSLIATAFGRRGHPRQVENLERGQLRHPVYSSDRKRWAKLPQRIRPRWFSEPAGFAVPAAVRKLNDGAARIARRLANKP